MGPCPFADFHRPGIGHLFIDPRGFIRNNNSKTVFFCNLGLCGVLHHGQNVPVCPLIRLAVVCLIVTFGSRSMFLLERLHIIRAPFVRKRTDDRLWLGGTLFLFASLGAISIWSLVTPHAELSSKDGQCRIGIARVPSYTLFTFDVIMNAALTIAFVILLRPYLELRERTSAYHGEGNPPAAVGRFRRLFRQIGLPAFRKDEEMDSFSSNIRNVLWKNVIGSSLALLASLANQIVSFTEKHNQGAFVCLMGCMADGKHCASTPSALSRSLTTSIVTCGVLVVHWLTLGSNEETQALQPPRGHTASLSSSSTITPATKSEHTSKNPQTHT